MRSETMFIVLAAIFSGMVIVTGMIWFGLQLMFP